jgi:hypothetical protein
MVKVSVLPRLKTFKLLFGHLGPSRQFEIGVRHKKTDKEGTNTAHHTCSTLLFFGALRAAERARLMQGPVLRAHAWRLQSCSGSTSQLPLSYLYMQPARAGPRSAAATLHESFNTAVWVYRAILPAPHATVMCSRPQAARLQQHHGTCGHACFLIIGTASQPAGIMHAALSKWAS